jgi:hypothetical protein
MIERLELSSTGRAKCRRCRAAIAKGEPRAVNTEPASWDGYAVTYLHLRCAIDVDASAVREQLRRFQADFADRSEIVALVESRVRAMIEAAKPAAERDPAALAVDTAADPTGRPRVRVFLAGSAFSFGNGPALDLERVTRDQTVRSPTREYRFVQQYTGIPSLPEDPSQPVIGAVFATFAGAKIMANQRQKISAWKARGLPTPVLWVFARGAQATATDEQILGLRALLDDVGYAGDEALVRATRKVDDDSLAALVEALDEAIPAIAPPAEDPRPGDLRFAAQLEDFIDQGRDGAVRDALVKALTAVNNTRKSPKIPARFTDTLGFETLTPEGRAAIGRAAVRALALDPCVDDALELLSKCPETPLGRAPLDALARLLSNPKKRLAKTFTSLTKFINARAIEGRGAVLCDAIERCETEVRTIELAVAILAAKDPDAEQRLLAWIDALAKSDPRRAWLSLARYTLAARQKRRATPRT